MSVEIAVAVSFGWGFLLQLTAFWLLDVRGPNQLGWLTAQFFAGVFVPVVFFPAWLAQSRTRRPSRRWRSCRSRCSSASIPASSWLGVFVVQLFWAAVLFGAGRLVLRSAMRKVVVQGG